MPHQIGCKHCKGVSQKQFEKKSAPRKRGHRPNHQPPYFKSKREDVTRQERGQNTNVHLQLWDDKQFELKRPNWNLWAYTDGSCIGKAENFIGAGVYCPQTKAECYVDSGGVGMTNTINRAELSVIAAALTNKYTQIATDSACSLSQIRKQLLFPEMQRAHIHSNLLEQIVSMIYASPEPICFYKVKAHSGIAGNECADAIAKHSAIHDGGHYVHFQPPAPDGNAYTHLYWLATKDTDEDFSGRGAITPRLRALSDIKAKLKTEMCKSHRLGSAKTGTGYYNYWKDFRPLVNSQAANAFWNNSNLGNHTHAHHCCVGNWFHT